MFGKRDSVIPVVVANHWHTVRRSAGTPMTDVWSVERKLRPRYVNRATYEFHLKAPEQI